MALESKELKRIFKHKDLILEDPDENMTTNEVLDFYSNQYPELNNSTVSGPEITKDNIVYNFSTTIGTKG